MNESKHTRGPWNAPPSHPFLVRSSNMELVVDCRRGGNVCYTAEDVANARLIAAAPELLEACEAALEYDAEIHRHAAINQKDPKSWVGCEELDRLYEKWTSASRAAIARASGGPFGAKEGEANARLIAAAPELLIMCKTLLPLVRLKFGNLDEGVTGIMARAEEIIAKAEGEQT